MRLPLLALIVYVLYSWLTGTSQADIDKRFATVAGKGEGPYIFMKVFNPIRLNGVLWRDLRNEVISNKDREVLDSIINHYAPRAGHFYDTIKVASYREWQEYVQEQEADSLLDETIFQGNPVIITKHWESFEPLQAICLKVGTADDLFEIDYKMFPGVKREYKDGDFLFTDGSYERYFNGLKDLIENEPALSLKYLKKDSAELPYDVYEVYNHKEERIFIDEAAYESIKTRYVRDDDGLGDFEPDERFTLWYEDWNFRIFAGILVIVTFFGFIADITRRGRKAVYQINILDDEENFAWEIIERKGKAGPFTIPLTNFSVNIYYKKEEVQLSGKPPEEKQMVVGLVFFNKSEDEDEMVYYHFNARDYIITPSLIKQIMDLKNDAVTSLMTSRVLESRGGNEFESRWTHTYVLEAQEGEEGESHTYHTTNRR